MMPMGTNICPEGVGGLECMRRKYIRFSVKKSTYLQDSTIPKTKKVISGGKITNILIRYVRG